VPIVVQGVLVVLVDTSFVAVVGTVASSTGSIAYIVHIVVDSCRRTGSVRQPMTFDRVVYQVVDCMC